MERYSDGQNARVRGQIKRDKRTERLRKFSSGSLGRDWSLVLEIVMKKSDKVRVNGKCENKDFVGEIGIIAKIEEGYCSIIFERIWGVFKIKIEELDILEE